MRKKIIVSVMLLSFFITLMMAKVYLHGGKGSYEFITDGYSQVYFDVDSLSERQNDTTGKGESVFCLNYGASIDCTGTLNQTIKINGKEATSGTKKSSDKSNAKIAYIAYVARTEYVEAGNHRSSKTQNAIWYYFPTFYNYNKSRLNISDKFKTSTVGSPNSVINDAEEYYKYLEGDKKVKLNASNIKTYKVDNLEGKNNIKNKLSGCVLIGPFSVSNTNTKFIKNDYTIKDNNGKKVSVITANDYNSDKYKTSFTCKFGESYYIIDELESQTDKEYVVDYSVVQYNATLKFFSTPSGYQNILTTNAQVSSKKLQIGLPVNSPEMSLQKYIVEYGSNFTKTNNNITTAGTTRLGASRESRNAQDDSVNKIAKLGENEIIAEGSIKYGDPVLINENDYVVYKINVYNSSTSKDSESILVHDYIEEGEFVGIYQTRETSANSVVYKNSLTEIDNSSITINDTSHYGKINDNGYYRWVANVNKNSYKSYYVIVKYNNSFEDIKSNKAYLNPSNPKASWRYRIFDYDYVKMEQTTPKYNLSLQKYISQVFYDSNSQTYSDRVNKLADENTNENIAKNLSVSAENINYHKYDNYIKIKKDYSVEYMIIVYNNEKEIANNVIIEDYIPNYATIESVSDNVSYIFDQDSKMIKITIPSISAASDTEAGKIEIKIKLKFSYTDEEKEQVAGKILTNSAQISSETPNATQYRIIDYDYVMFESDAAVGLKKYILTDFSEKYDFNNDGFVDPQDYYCMKSYCDGTLNDNNIKNNIETNGDFNNDGDINDKDCSRFYYNLNFGGNRGSYTKSRKKSKPVEVKVGDKITYVINVINTGSNTLNNIKYIEDKNIFLGDNSNGKNLKLISISDLEGNQYVYSNNRIECINGLNIEKDKYKSIFVNVEIVSGKNNQKIENTATVLTKLNDYEIEDGDGPQNNTDSDYIIINGEENEYKVSLEKYITQVTDANGNNKVTYNNRSGKRYNSNASDEENKNPYKTIEDNYVKVEPGDIVTYKIKLTNEGESTIRVTEITDNFEENSEFLEFLGITGNGIGTINGDVISFENAPEITAGNSSYIIMQFRVSMDPQYTKNEVTITNIAEVTQITDQDDEIVEDGDGTNNNRDQDTIITETYAVSLEKYIVKVESKDGTAISYNNRSGKRYNTDYPNSNYNYYCDPNDKEKNWKKDVEKVEVEPGDIVTYEILLKNTGTKNVKITQIYDAFTCHNGEYELEYYEANGIIGNGNGTISDDNYKGSSGLLDTENTQRYLIEFDHPVLLRANDETIVKISFEVKSKQTDSKRLANTAKIVQLQNTNGVVVKDRIVSDNRDTDYVRTKKYEVSLKKYISAINGITLNNNTRDASDTYVTEQIREANPEDSNTVYSKTTNWDNTSATNTIKYNHPVTISNGDFVTYTIKVKNDSTNTKVKITGIEDVLPEGIDKYKLGDYSSNIGDYNNVTNRTLQLNRNNSSLLNAQQEDVIKVTVRVSEPNKSLRILRNTAEINELKNKNNYTIIDSTGYNNFDADYFQLNYKKDDGIISGTVWLDTARNKTSDSYNGKFDNTDNVEKGLEGIVVKLYRGNTLVADTTTSSNGDYSFKDSDLYDTLSSNERYIKGPKDPSSNRWGGSYYSYYIVFEYDGITYTSTFDNNGKRIWSINENNTEANYSNACEDNTNGKTGIETRTAFNNRFAKVNASGVYDKNGNKTTDIQYDRYIGKTSSGDLIIPQSIHKYNKDKMSIQSSTNNINLGDYTEEQIKHINLGLRGRDIFDLRLKSSVNSLNVSINGVTQRYVGNNLDNPTIRISDIIRDAANVSGEKIENPSAYDQSVRNSDKTYVDNITVTYQIDVENESISDGYATKIVDYYNSNMLKFENVKIGDNVYTNIPNGATIGGYPSKVISIDGNNQTIFITYSLTENAKTNISNLGTNTTFSVYHTAEIAEYKNESKGNNEATRGLLDLDSAPDSAKSEKAILTTDYNSVNNGQKKVIIKTSGETTVEYYFNNNASDDLKYEDDTRPKAAKFNITNNYSRILNGNVFEDFIDETLLESTKIKSGNGVKDSGEPGIYGATVTLTVKGVNGHSDYTSGDITTNNNGSYTISGFIPGEALLTFKYGDTEKTILFNKNQDGNTNKKSYNGEDFQSTNNTGTHGSQKLDTSGNYWYVKNDNGISVAIDKSTVRTNVSQYVNNINNKKTVDGVELTQSDYIMQALNKVRAGIKPSDTEINDIKNNLAMEANTNKFVITVEQARISGNEVLVKNSFSDNIISNMNFGISEVPVTTVDLKNNISSFTITDASGENVIAKAIKQPNGTWETEGDTIVVNDKLVTQIEEQKLQGANLKVVYNISADINEQIDFRGNSNNKAIITGIFDFVDNNLSYNSQSGDNSNYWETISISDVKEVYGGTGTVASDDKQYTTILKLMNDKINSLTDTAHPITLTLEKVLSSSDVTLENILSNINTNSYEYINKVEIAGIDYSGVKLPDRIRTPKSNIPSTELQESDPQSYNDEMDKYITESYMTIIPGAAHDYKSSELASSIPPLGENNDIKYYVIAIASISILVAGIILVKKYAIKNN